MKVIDLIEVLSTMDLGLNLYVYNEHGEYVKISDACDFIVYKEDEYGRELEIDSVLIY